MMHSFHHHLHRWYAGHGRRDLPWRNTSDPYAIYVSEVMLQQTQVKTVLERFYFPFLERFPTISALAAASQDEVLSAWHGLGYYSRAINLWKAAKEMVSSSNEYNSFEDLVPMEGDPRRHDMSSRMTVDQLLSLPGVGRNTAHAVAAFAYRQPVAVMEANVKRVLCRIFALEKPSEAELWERAGALLDTASPFDYNQAMMDIGSMVCTKRAPRCGECPAAVICQGKDAPETYPAPKAKKAPPVRVKRIAVLRNARGEYYARPRVGRFLHGLYHFVESDGAAPQLTFHKKRYAFAKAVALGRIRQQYSHFTLDAEVFLIHAGAASGNHWHSRAELEQLPVSMAEKKIIQLINN